MFERRREFERGEAPLSDYPLQPIEHRSKNETGWRGD
jgi:hypothetical protein